MLEFVIVVVGISLSFFLQDLREEHSRRAEEERFLAGFARELRADLDVLNARRKALMTIAADLRSALDQEQRKDLTEKDLDGMMDGALTYLTFAPSQATYLELRQAGASKLIRDKDLLGEIIRLYEADYLLAAEWDRINRELVLQRMFPYLEQFGPNIQVSLDGALAAGFHVAFLSLEQKQWFRNPLSTNAMFKDAQGSVYGRLPERVENLLALLK